MISECNLLIFLTRRSHSQDEQLFDAILANQKHVLHQLLPPLSDASQRYILRPVHITDSYQITRLTFVSVILLIDYCTKTLTENVFIPLCCV